MNAASKLSMTLLSEPSGLRLENVAIGAKTVSLSAASTCPSAACPLRQNGSDRLHSHYRRTVTETRAPLDTEVFSPATRRARSGCWDANVVTRLRMGTSGSEYTSQQPWPQGVGCGRSWSSSRRGGANLWRLAPSIVNENASDSLASALKYI